MDYSSRNIKAWSRLGACGAYGIALADLASRRQDVVAVTADLRFFSGLDRYAAQYSDRFFNIGIAEQDLLGVAAGMAREGFVPFASTYASFASSRAADQVRVGMAYMGLPVKLVGLTSGLSVGILGPTHMGLEDIAVMRSMPGITVLSPADCTATCKAVEAAATVDGPVYIRLTGGQPNPVVYDQDFDFEVGKANRLADGGDVAILATGSMVRVALDARFLLDEAGCLAAVYDYHTISPFDEDSLQSCLESKLIVTIEEHVTAGGFGSAVAEHLAGYDAKPSQLIIGCDGAYRHAGSYEYLLESYGLTASKVAERIRRKLNSLKERGV